MSNVTVRVEGLENLRRHLGVAAATAQPKLVAAERKVAERHIFPQTQREVPVDTGRLRSTGKVETSNDGVDIVYGPGGAEAYAKIQHDRTDFVHYGTGKALYVSDPVTQAAPQLPRMIASDMGNLFRGV